MDEPAVDLSRIYAEYHRKVASYAARLLGRDDAEDVAQEVFVKIGRSLDTLEDPSKLPSWIYAITLNTVRDTARKRRSRSEEPAGDAPADTRSPTPDGIIARNEMVACYLDYVKRLPPAQYGVYVLSTFEDLTNAEIARRLSLPLSTVKIRLHRARTALHEELRKNCRCYQNERGELMGEPKPR